MTINFNNHSQITTFNYLKPGNKKYKNLNNSKKISTKNERYSETEKNAMVEMYTEIITVMINQHFE